MTIDSETAPATLMLRSGPVQGIRTGGVERFNAIPYAMPPVGARRFEPPVPAEGNVGVREGTQPGPTAPQRTKAVPGLDVAPLIGPGWREGDDYLVLDVIRPADAPGGRPIMVFIHGGGFVVGAKDASVQAGSSFARDGVIFVSVAYRLGVEGFLPIPGVPTNLGLRDMIAALTWVRGHAAELGGDPDNITVFGESAGAMAIADLVTSPLAKGLFRRVIIQSGHGAMTRDIPVAQRLVRKVAKLLGIAPTRAGFASVVPGDALDALEKVSLPTTRLDLRDADGREPVFGISRFIPVHGDDVLPQPPLEALKQGAGSDIDVLIGSNAEEMNLYFVPTGVLPKVGWLLAWLILRRSQPRAWRVLKAYGLGRDRPGEVLVRALSDLVFRWPARRFAEEHRGRTWMYEFEWRSPRYEGGLGAAHGMELPFVFDSLATVTGPEGLCGEAPPQALADRIHALWVRFATDGTLPWPEFTREKRNVHQLAADRTVEEPPMPAARFLP
ncbi:carboxylesterase/lipase family protein [Sphingomonas jatrophae]|uniref:Para-nitrobenzyl esterase n=1 Tax=Sphingomonas jatrophae TaxID=1166337 RepID=A0A1I6M2N4_9SPHN|nr:carboxylesterase family protein [Sphingomonas jatrophae]SFS09923.1 para-nitrobenzyl esterase [Sphingomonas jatrophae]